MKGRLSPLALAQLLVCLAFLAGLFSFLAPCGPKPDGGFMVCRWAGRAVTGLAAVLCVIAALRLLMKDARIRAGLDLAAIPTALLAALTPGRLINLCMMADMRCRSVMRPGILVFSVLILALAAADLIVNGKKK